MNADIIAAQAKRLGREIREVFGQQSHPKYGLHLVYACWQARLCGYQKIMAIEMGVAGGGGIAALDHYASLCYQHLEVRVDIVGFDTGSGLPDPLDFRDHPEIWRAGDYRARLADTRIIYGDVSQTLGPWLASLQDQDRIGFVSLDLDLYSSTKAALAVFEQEASSYLPAVLVHVDDANTHLTLNPWCGAELAINEFNAQHDHRKFEQKHRCWNQDNMYVLHVLDHPIRQGREHAPWPIDCSPL